MNVVNHDHECGDVLIHVVARLINVVSPRIKLLTLRVKVVTTLTSVVTVVVNVVTSAHECGDHNHKYDNLCA